MIVFENDAFLLDIVVLKTVKAHKNNRPVPEQFLLLDNKAKAKVGKCLKMLLFFVQLRADVAHSLR